MLKVSLMPILPLLLWGLSGCASRTIAVADCPKAAPLPARLQVPAPDPEIFPQCLNQLLAQTSAMGLTPSCALVQTWLSAFETIKPAKETP